MNIRRATAADSNALSFLFDQYRIFYKKESDLAAAELFLQERMERQESVIFVAEDEDEEIRGFVQLYPLFSSTRMKRLWLLNDLYVAEPFRRMGISTLLIERSKEHTRETNACGLLLETEKSNIEGNNLYHKTGFGLDETHHYYYWDC